MICPEGSRVRDNKYQPKKADSQDSNQQQDAKPVTAKQHGISF